MTQASVVKSTCGMCFAAGGVLIQVRDGKVVKIKGDPQSPVNHGVLCPKGRAAPELLYHPDRLKQPLVKNGTAVFTTGTAEVNSQSAILAGEGICFSKIAGCIHIIKTNF